MGVVSYGVDGGGVDQQVTADDSSTLWKERHEWDIHVECVCV